jgi:glutamate racemase
LYSSDQSGDQSIVSRGNVLVLDSGVGGLSICRSILKLCPQLHIRYVADDAAFPYGTKDDDFLIERLSELIAQCHERFSFDLVILACNTASTLVLPSLRERFDVPFVGVVPAIKPAAMQSRTKAIGLLATPGTVSREYTDALIRDFAADCSVLKVGSNALVEQAERLLFGDEVDQQALQSALDPFADSFEDIDTIVLGCTHFPFLQKHLALLMPEVIWIDSGDAIARRVQSLLQDALERAGGETGSPEKHQVLFTGLAPDSSHFRLVLDEIGMSDAEISRL